MPFPRVLVLREMQTVLLWTRITKSTFYDNNRYAINASMTYKDTKKESLKYRWRDSLIDLLTVKKLE